MDWDISWSRDECTATHRPTGATFKASRSGWIGCIESGTATDAQLRGLMSELVVMLDFAQAEAAQPDPRLLH